MQAQALVDWRDTEFLNAKQIAEVLGISTDTAYGVVHHLPHVKVGRALRVRTEIFEKWIRDGERGKRQ